jgi:hypothetical protein
VFPSGAILLLAAVFAAINAAIIRWQMRKTRIGPASTASDWHVAVIVVLCSALAAGLFGFGLAMLLDRIVGGWGVVLAAVICVAIAPACWRLQVPAEER